MRYSGAAHPPGFVLETVLFVCTHNSARSQIAEGILRACWGDRDRVLIAGPAPGGVNPLAMEDMLEHGIDISEHRSDHVDSYIDQPLDYVVTVCDSAKEACPYIPVTARNIRKSFPNPAALKGSDELKLAAFRIARDAIASWIEATFGTEEDDLKAGA